MQQQTNNLETPVALDYKKTMAWQRNLPQDLSALYSEFLGLLLSRQATPEKIRELIAKGARRNVRTVDGGYTPLHVAFDYGYGVDVINALLEDGPDLKALGITPRDLLNARTPHGSLPVHLGRNETSKLYLLGQVSREEMQHLFSGIVAMKKKLTEAGAGKGEAKNLGGLTYNILVDDLADDLTNQRMVLLDSLHAYDWSYGWPNYSDKEAVRKAIKQQIINSIKEFTKKPDQKSALNQEAINALNELSNTAQ